MLQSIFFIICTEITMQTDDTDLSPITIHKKNRLKRIREKKCGIHDENLHHETVTTNKKDNKQESFSFFLNNDNKLYLDFDDENNNTTTIDGKNLQDLTDYKSLMQKLKKQTETWDLEAKNNKENMKQFFIVNSRQNRICNYKKEREAINYIRKRLYTKLNEHFNTIIVAVQNIPTDEYTDNLKDQLDFFEQAFKILHYYTGTKYDCNKIDCHKVIEFFKILPIRIDTFDKKFQIVDRFEAFKIFLEYKYLLNISKNDKKLIQIALDEIHMNLKYYFDDLYWITIKSNNIIKIVERAMLKCKFKKKF
ncbi:uncharacterized protein VNE69_11165 [Vairimorpha necatrix]|uniref:Uncharacterized protein n=1 Tax=Vairimorpha necatrix TaxID=6039 RepID=A0AAX4JG82_9MICR